MPTKQARKSEGETKSEGTSKRTPRGSSARKRPETAKAQLPARKWSAEVTDKSEALHLEGGVFASDSPTQIAKSLKHYSQASRRRKSDPFRSALSMLTFYINRAGKNLTAAKGTLRQLFGRKRKLSIKRVQ